MSAALCAAGLGGLGCVLTYRRLRMSARPIHLTLAWADWLNLFGHFLLLSLMSLGGAISTSSEMHRFLVEQHHWLTQEQFNDSIALAQAAPGPNVLFVALMGWHVGMNAGSTGAACSAC
jgi:chromate transporter